MKIPSSAFFFIPGAFCGFPTELGGHLSPPAQPQDLVSSWFFKKHNVSLYDLSEKYGLYNVYRFLFLNLDCCFLNLYHDEQLATPNLFSRGRVCNERWMIWEVRGCPDDDDWLILFWFPLLSHHHLLTAIVTQWLGASCVCLGGQPQSFFFPLKLI